MNWTPRQAAMLAEMGLQVWPRRVEVDPLPLAAQAADDVRPESEVATLSAASVRTSESAAAPDSSTPPTLQGVGPATLAHALRVDTLDWAALREVVAGCTACGLCAGRTQTVFGVGSLRAHWMVVGEAPGEQEDLRGEPFVGKSGQLLDAMLRASGLTRTVSDDPADDDPARQVYIANSVKCRPPGNRNPEPDELARCEAYLVRQVQLLQPRVIVAMGRFAVQSLLRSNEPLGKLRGRVHRYQGVPLIVTYHPAYLLRSPGEKAKAWDDLCLAAETLATGSGVTGPAVGRF